MILTEVHLLESRVYRGIGNLAKAKVRLPSPLIQFIPRSNSLVSILQAALTSARTAANSIYCPPHLQAQLDLQSGILHAEDKDYTTAYSYFFETFENLSAQDDSGALGALKYMLLCKVMLNLVSQPFLFSLSYFLTCWKYDYFVAGRRDVAIIHQAGDQVRAIKRRGEYASCCKGAPEQESGRFREGVEGLSERALVRPNDPNTPLRIIRYPPGTESTTDSRALLGY